MASYFCNLLKYLKWLFGIPFRIFLGISFLFIIFSLFLICWNVKMQLSFKKGVLKILSFEKSRNYFDACKVLFFRLTSLGAIFRVYFALWLKVVQCLRYWLFSSLFLFFYLFIFDLCIYESVSLVSVEVLSQIFYRYYWKLITL